MRHVGQTRDIRDVAARVGDGFGEDELCASRDDRRGVIGRVVARDEGRLDPKPPQRDVELRDRSAVEVRRRDDVVARAGERGEGDELRAEAAGRGYRSECALQARHALFKARDRGV